jgi:hypothetical protein
MRRKASPRSRPGVTGASKGFPTLSISTEDTIGFDLLGLKNRNQRPRT